MVIQKFNRLIRNKWVWSVFAIIVSAAFCFDSLFNSRGDAADVAEIAGEPVKRELFNAVVDDVRRRGQNRAEMDHETVMQQAKERLALLKVAENLALEVSDAEVRDQIQKGFFEKEAFDFKRYEALVRQFGFSSPEAFEATMKRDGAVQRVQKAVYDAVSIVAPNEVDLAVYDYTDEFTVRVARFTQSKSEADKVKADDAAVKKWYDENSASLTLPKRYRVKYVKLDATAKEITGRMSVSENDMLDYYDSNYDRYTSYDTNGVEVVKKFEEVKPAIEKELRRKAAVEFYTTNLMARVTGAGAPLLAKVAAENKLKVVESPWFAADGSVHDGFSVAVYSFAPGAEDFIDAASALYDPETQIHNMVVSSGTAVWLIEKSAESQAGVPAFEDCKEIIRPRVLSEAREQAFKDSVTAVRNKGFDAVCAGKNVSTNLTFCVVDLSGVKFDDQYEVVNAAKTLKKGEVSDFVSTAPGKALLVACIDRKAGDPAKVHAFRPQLSRRLADMRAMQMLPAWSKWNLDRLGLKLRSDSPASE